MSTIVLAIFYAKSHHYAAFRLASGLIARGHNVIFTGPEIMRSFVEDSGFQYYVQPLVKATPIYLHNKPLKEEMVKYRDWYLEGEMFEGMIAELQPDLVILDTSFVNYSFLISSHHVPVVILQTTMPLEKCLLVPPINSSYIPKRGFISILIIEFLWQRFFFHRRWREFVFRIKYGFNEFSLVRRKAHFLKFPLRFFNFRRAVHLGVSVFPELILAPKEFNFPYRQRRNQFFVPPVVGFEGRKHAEDESYYSQVDKIARKPVVYCSFGTMINDLKFFELLIEIFADMPDYNLVLSVGDTVDLEPVQGLPENIFLFACVPQLEVLKDARLMINHGGLNSILECIYYEVPMIVFPATRWFDQQGNGARVKYHGIGLTGSLKDGPETVSELINTVLLDESFRMRVGELKRKIFQDADLGTVFDLIEKQIV